MIEGEERERGGEGEREEGRVRGEKGRGERERGEREGRERGERGKVGVSEEICVMGEIYMRREISIREWM